MPTPSKYSTCKSDRAEAARKRKERVAKRGDKRKKALREQGKSKKAKTTPKGGGSSSAKSTEKRRIPRSLVTQEKSSSSDTSDDESDSDGSAVSLDLDDFRPIKGKKKKPKSMSALNERIRKLTEGADTMKTTAENLVTLMENTQAGIGANSDRIVEVHQAAVSESRRISERQEANEVQAQKQRDRLNELESKYQSLLSSSTTNRPVTTTQAARSEDPFQDATRDVETNTVQSIYCILRMERRSLVRKPKKTREGIAHLALLLSEVHECRMPIQLARAIFERDLANILKYAPIMGDDAQELYEEKLEEKSRKTAATVQSITDEILKESLALTTDSSAEEVMDTTTESLNSWLINAWVYTRPLLERWWNPIFEGTVIEFDAFMAKVRTDAIGFSWGLIDKALKSTMTKEKRIIGQYMRVSSQANSRAMAEFRLTDQFDKELQKQQLKALSEVVKDRSPGQEVRDKKKTKSGTPKAGTKQKEDLEKAIAQSMGKEFKLSYQSIRGLPWHVDPKSGKNACLYGCAKEIFGVGAMCTKTNCERSHVAKDCYPHGKDCVVGKCPESCPSRKNNTE